MKETTQNQQEKEITQTIGSLTNFMIDKNIAELDKILDKNFTLTHITGRVQSKNDWLDEIRSESMRYLSYEEVKMEVVINGNSAEVTNRNILEANIWGMHNHRRLQQVVTLEKKGSKWIILKSVASTF